MAKFKVGEVLIVGGIKEPTYDHMMEVVQVTSDSYIVRWLNHKNTTSYDHDVIDRNLIKYRIGDPNFAFQMKKQKEE